MMQAFDFKDLRATDAGLVGGKAANLGELTYVQVADVPGGFVILPIVFTNFLVSSGLDQVLAKFIEALDPSDLKRLHFIAGRIRQIIGATPWPYEFKDELWNKMSSAPSGWAVRSSAIGEDGEGTSFAGQHDSYLRVYSGQVPTKVKQCFASLYEPRALAYRLEHGLSVEDAQMAVVVQQMVSSKVSGVMFTQDYNTGEDKVIIEAVWGLGEAIVSGQVTPDHYEVDPVALEILDLQSKYQDQKISEKAGGWIPVLSSQKAACKLSQQKIRQLASIGSDLAQHYGYPLDIEWAMDDDQFYVLQARPITSKAKDKGTGLDKPVRVSGAAASFGMGTGPVRVITNVSQLSEVQPGDVLVTRMTTPDYVPVFKLLSALVTDLGGATCHAAIISREFNLPCVVGTQSATTILMPGELVTVDGGHGVVHQA